MDIVSLFYNTYLQNLKKNYVLFYREIINNFVNIRVNLKFLLLILSIFINFVCVILYSLESHSINFYLSATILINNFEIFESLFSAFMSFMSFNQFYISAYFYRSLLRFYGVFIYLQISQQFLRIIYSILYTFSKFYCTKFT